ncbi:MAG: YhdT family protein [Thermovirgaceae bacterium]
MERQEYYSRDYEFSEIEPDPRFLVCRREMFISFGVWFLYALAAITVAYWFGRGPVEEYVYVFGFPLWWFGTMTVVVVFTFIVMAVTKYVFKDMDLTDVGTIEGEN